MSYVNHYDLWSNYYQHCGQQFQNDEQLKQTKQQDNTKQDKPRVKDLIDKALAKAMSHKNVTPIEAVKTDEDVEEGQIVCSPKQLYREDSSVSTPSKASSPMTPLDSSVTRNSSKSRSRSQSNTRLLKSRSRSRSRRYHSHSRSRSRTPSRVRRRRSRSRSRSPYLGPIIKDYRRGRRAYIRYPRGYRVNIRPYRRTQYSSNYHLSYGFSRRHEFSRSRSRSFSPKRRSRTPADIEKSVLIEEKPSDGKHSENLKPSDIKMSQKKITQSFLAMLEEKQNKSKMVPIMSNKGCEMTEGDEAFNKQHGFVNTFNTVREIDGQKHTLSYDLEREGWQVIDDASSESGHHRRHKIKEAVYRYESTVAKNSERNQYVSEDKQIIQPEVDDSSSSEEESKKKKKKTKKRKKKKKKKSSTSNDSSISDSDEEFGDDSISKKKIKKKKKTSKKKKKKANSPSSSDNEEKESKHKKKKKKKKKKSVSSDTDSKEKLDETVGVIISGQVLAEVGDEKKDIANEIIKDGVKTKDKKKKKRKAESSSTDSESEKNEKKKKKKSKKKKVKKRKHHSSSSSSSSESSDSSESFQKKKKKKRSKKSKRSKKHKKEKKSDKKEKTKLNNDDNKKSMNDEESKKSEFVTVYSIGEPPLELKWPKNLINFTSFEPSLQYSINPKVIYSADDFIAVDDKRKCGVDLFQRKDKNNEMLASEYERFIDELKPAIDFTGAINEQSLALEVKMREKLLKQMGDNSKQTSEEHILVTPSEKRAMEKMKKQYQKLSDEQEAQRRHEELKSAPLSTYYSVKRQNKCSDHENEELEKSADTNNKLKESDVFCKTDDISITIAERTHKHESRGNEYVSKVEDKKKTARELLERVKQKKSSGKESNDDTKSSKRSLHIGKIKKQTKKESSSKKSVSSTTASITDNTQKIPFESKPMKLDINYDYNWYYQYYRNNYGMGQYPSNITSAAAYYAQYALITSYDYSHQDLSNWMHSKGYLLENTPKTKENNINKKFDDFSNINQVTTDDIKLKENSIEPKIESTMPEIVAESDSQMILETEKIDGNELIECSQTQSIERVDNESKTESFGKITDLKTSQIDNNLNMQQSIEVIVSSVHNNMSLKHLNNTDKSENDCAPNMSPFCSANMKHKVKVRVTTNSQSELASESCGSPTTAPPPPPKRPKMTTFTSMNAITLPNGQVLPAGTKQIVVHPYQYPYSNRFSAEWYYNAFDAHNTAKTAAIDTQSIIAN